MPVNAPMEYFKAEEKFKQAKTTEQKIVCLEEMLSLLPKHHGSENMHAQLKSRLAKLKRESISSKKRSGKKGIVKEGEAQVCILGKTMSGKSTILSKLTDARPKIADHPYTTIKPEVGMMDYNGIKIQLVEIPSTFDSEYLSICRTAELIIFVIADDREKEEFMTIKKDNFIRTSHLFVDANQSVDDIRNKIWDALDFILVYTRNKGRISPMALKHGSRLKDFAFRIHKDFVRNFRFAQIWRKTNGNTRKIQAGLEYILQDNDVIELRMK